MTNLLTLLNTSTHNVSLIPDPVKPDAGLNKLWSQLLNVRSLRFDAHSEVETGWNGSGIGSVTVSEPAAGVVVFEEAGVWQSLGQCEVRFTNVFRWSAVGERIRLEHLRYGPNHPVFLFDLAPDESGEWREVSPHQCREDRYSASLTVEEQQLRVVWRIRGSRKQERIHYIYE